MFSSPIAWAHPKKPHSPDSRSLSYPSAFPILPMTPERTAKRVAVPRSRRAARRLGVVRCIAVEVVQELLSRFAIEKSGAERIAAKLNQFIAR